jgi:uncharacterized protein (TIGR03435 family)
MRGGPGSDDPSQISYTNITLMSILRIAYDAYPYQIVGPSWLGVNGYDISAKLPPGTTKEQFNRMLVNLLVERFHLALHHESRDVQGFELVTGKNGSKLKESTLVDSVGAEPTTSGPPKTDANGFPQLNHPGVAMTMKMAPNAKVPSALITFRAQVLAGLVRTLGEELGRPVVDKTGLVGKYDFTLEFAPEKRTPETQGSGDALDQSGPGILTAIQDQLGLKLESKKVLFDMLIIDAVDKIPTAN